MTDKTKKNFKNHPINKTKKSQNRIKNERKKSIFIIKYIENKKTKRKKSKLSKSIESTSLSC